MMTDLRARLADALKQHQFWHANHSSIGSNAHCLCGLRPRDQSEWADHVVADVLLSLPGIAIVELPKPAFDLWDDGDAALFQAESATAVRVHQSGQIIYGADWLSPSEARSDAAALLAAADTAEEGS